MKERRKVELEVLEENNVRREQQERASSIGSREEDSHSAWEMESRTHVLFSFLTLFFDSFSLNH